MSDFQVPSFGENKKKTSENTYIWVVVSIFLCLLLCVFAAFAGLGYWMFQDGRFSAVENGTEQKQEQIAEEANLLEQISVDPQWGMELKDEFGNNANDWEVGPYQGDSVSLKRSIENGKYTWDFKSTSFWAFWAFPETGESLSDFSAYVELTHLAGSRHDGAGLVFRSNSQGVYIFYVLDVGRVVLTYYDGKDGAIILDKTTSAVIRNGTNRVFMRAIGQKFTFYVNDQLVGEVEDDRLTAGRVGIVISAAGEPDSVLPPQGNNTTEVSTIYEVDNFQVWSPVTGVGLLPPLKPEAGNLLYVVNDSGDREIYAVDVTNAETKRLTNNKFDDYAPRWSPDGSQIAFVSTRDGNPEIYIMNNDGTGIERITDDEASDSTPEWSPDGTKIAFASKRNGNYEIYVYDLKTDSVEQLTETSQSEDSPMWSPDGDFIVYKANQFGATHFEKMVLATGEVVKVGVPFLTTQSRPILSNDGKYISYEFGIPTAGSGIIVLNLETKEHQIVIDRDALNTSPSWSPVDGQIAYASNRRGVWAIYVVSVDGKSQSRIFESDLEISDLDWFGR